MEFALAITVKVETTIKEKFLDRSKLILGLSQCRAYPFYTESVTMLQTHVSLLFFTGRKVYKVKKDVTFDFLDFSSLERRRYYCEEELRLNRRLSPEMYLKMVPITRNELGELSVEGEGDVVEYAVKMRQLPKEKMLDCLLEKGDLSETILDELVDKLAKFHATSECGDSVKKYGELENISHIVKGNLDVLEKELPSQQYEYLKSYFQKFIKSNENIFEKRIDENRIRDGHGDLHAGNICITDEGIMIYDCIEFSPAYRCADVACDIAFLAMDLDKRGHKETSNSLVKKYVEKVKDPDIYAVIDFYKAYRALVRAKVAVLKMSSCDLLEGEKKQAIQEKRDYVRLAISYCAKPFLIITCGLPGSGKSWISHKLSQIFDAVILRTDVIRKELAGISPTQSGGGEFEEGIYTEKFTEKTYQTTLDRAEKQLSDNRVVVVDAGFARRSQRDLFRKLAEDKSYPFILFHVSCADSVIRDRMELRKKDREEVSDAGFDVYQEVAKIFEDPDELPHYSRIPWEQGADEELTMDAVIDSVIEQSFKENGSL